MTMGAVETPRCGWQSVSDEVPCEYELGHVRQPGNWRHHRVRSPYGDGRWRDFDDLGNLFAFGGWWDAAEVERMVGNGAQDRRETSAPANREVLWPVAPPETPVGRPLTLAEKAAEVAAAKEAGWDGTPAPGVSALIEEHRRTGRLPRSSEAAAVLSSAGLTALVRGGSPVGPLGQVGPMITAPTGELVAAAMSTELARGLVEAYNAALEQRRARRPVMRAVPAPAPRVRPVI